MSYVLRVDLNGREVRRCANRTTLRHGHPCVSALSVGAWGSDESYRTPRFPAIRRRRAMRACSAQTLSTQETHVIAKVSRQTYPFSLPDLPYAYDALEPHIDAATLAHPPSRAPRHVREEAQRSVVERRATCRSSRSRSCCVTPTKLPEEIRAAVKNNGGGHLNHDLFWKSMAPAPSRRAARRVRDRRCERDFGSVEAFRKKFSDAAAKHFASGWVALSLDHASQKLAIVDLKDHEVVQRQRCHDDPHPRRLGARLLPEISESAAGIHRRRSGTSSTGRAPTERFEHGAASSGV